MELYRLLPLDFKKFIKLKKEFTNKKLRKLLPKRYYNFINICCNGTSLVIVGMSQ